MRKQLSLLLAFGCVGAVAGTAVNYDLLGRAGSKMNSPMVYKNVDYAKNQKKTGSSLKNQALMKQGAGLKNNVCALEGRFNSVGWRSDNTQYYYSTKQYCAGNLNLRQWTGLNTGYLEASNNAFITTKMKNAASSAYESARETYSNASGYSVSWGTASTNHTVQSPYESGTQIEYQQLSYIRDNSNYSNRQSFNGWYNNLNSADKSDVGVALITTALPAWMKRNDDVKFIRKSPTSSFNTMRGFEIEATGMYKVLKNTSKRSTVYSTTAEVQDPSLSEPQIYIGLRSVRNSRGHYSAVQTYKSVAADIDNYIYDNRTLEIIPAGNSTSSNKYFVNKSHAANAITVGAFDPKTNKNASYNPTISPKYCPSSDKTSCNNGSTANKGTTKPEVYNYSHLYTGDQKKIYTSGSTQYTYQPFYDGTEAAAAYTAGMVSDLLATNAFYRWHPEVVKALLITSAHASKKKVPTYESLISAKGSNNKVAHESRYWVGDFSKFEDSQYNKQIRFSIKTSDFKKKNFVAAISWLNRGDDILKLGRIPQDFSIYAFPSDDGDIHSPTPYAPAYASPHVVTDNFEKITFTQTRDYMVFQINFREDVSSADYKNQIVLGFDLAAYD